MTGPVAVKRGMLRSRDQRGLETNFFGLGLGLKVIGLVSASVSCGNGLGSHMCWSRDLRAIICFLN